MRRACAACQSKKAAFITADRAHRAQVREMKKKLRQAARVNEALGLAWRVAYKTLWISFEQAAQRNLAMIHSLRDESAPPPEAAKRGEG